MKKFLKWIGIIAGGFLGVLVLAAVVIVAIGRSRFVEPFAVNVKALDIPTDEASLARGEHLVAAVAHCGYCHGENFAGQIVVDQPNTVGVVVAPNLTAGTGGIGQSYTSEDWVRTLHHGITAEGRSIFIMPSILFSEISESDLAAIIAYVQTIPAIDNELPQTQLGPLAYALLGAGPLQQAQSARLIDHDAPFAPSPAEGETARYGAYLAKIGQCSACHGPDLAGGQACRDCPIGPNLTPGGELQGWTKEDFITVIRTGRHLTGRELNEVMPWRYFRHMSDSELTAIWHYLQAQPALETVTP